MSKAKQKFTYEAALNDADENVRVRANKMQYFDKLGLTFRQTQFALKFYVDHHDLDNLIKAGCPIETALQILRKF